ncbi:hypothetical protein [Pelosinus sp. IPA-1]|uniref:hypothetical protein n=1 Tax=Pelosinus sp. IPA-1 TaxID=3029569 RepID=UPI00243627B8|nr:hypothetical protein [Pelosinus sp. IPA-1]GMA98257.1 hypothetical protein PIPA1_10570 [Pelosinus sp. IPA-1]
MESKKTVLIKVAYLVELPEAGINSDDDILDKITSKLSEPRILEIEGRERILQWNSTSSLVLESKSLNSDKCSKCGQWTTDREKINAIKGICNGATVDGKLLCDECLPSDHKWAF